MKRCKTVNGLIKAIQKGEKATLKVYGTCGHKEWNYPVPDNQSIMLNLGNGKFSYVSQNDYKNIEPYLELAN